MSGPLQWQLLGCEYLISSRFQSFSGEREGGFGGAFKPTMSLGQSPLTTSSRVGWSGRAMLGRLQDTISEGGTDDVYNNGGVHKRLVFTVIVTLSSSSFVTSPFCFPSLRVGGQAFSDLLWSGHLQASKEVGWNWGVARGACCFGLCRQICRSQWLCSYIEARLHLQHQEFWVEAFVPSGIELRFSKTILIRYIGI